MHACSALLVVERGLFVTVPMRACNSSPRRNRRGRDSALPPWPRSLRAWYPPGMLVGETARTFAGLLVVGL